MIKLLNNQGKLTSGKSQFMSRKSGIIKKRIVWTRDGGYVQESIDKGWIMCPRSASTEADFGRYSDDYPENNPDHQGESPFTCPDENVEKVEGGEGECKDEPLTIPEPMKLKEIEALIRTPEESVTVHDGNGNTNDEDDRNHPGYGSADADEEMIHSVAEEAEVTIGDESQQSTSQDSFEPIAGPSGINFGATTSGLNLPSSFEDEEEGKRPRKKVCTIDYNDYDFDDEDYDHGYDYEDYDLDDDDSNNNEFGSTQTILPPPLIHHSYTRSQHYHTGEPREGISAADWSEAGPSGVGQAQPQINSQLESRPGSQPDSGPSSSHASAVSGPSSTGAVGAPSDSDLSSSCSHHSLVDRYTHMNISGCEDQTDEECAFDESDD